ncbi:MAG: MFS transporter [Mesorhizobium sp.]|nr:MAG: MFS transporter [Mesorhizobium sp.]
MLLPVYLASIGFGPLEIGVVATAALLGSALLTLGIGFLAVRADRRTLLLAASGLMIATGVAYTQSSTYAAVLLVAFLGTINLFCE